jgi:hypothetical protein
MNESPFDTTIDSVSLRVGRVRERRRVRRNPAEPDEGGSNPSDWIATPSPRSRDGLAMTKRGVESICMFVALLLATAITATAQERPEEASPDRARANFARTIAPADDDVRAFPATGEATSTTSRSGSSAEQHPGHAFNR